VGLAQRVSKVEAAVAVQRRHALALRLAAEDGVPFADVLVTVEYVERRMSALKAAGLVEHPVHPGP